MHERAIQIKIFQSEREILTNQVPKGAKAFKAAIG